MWVTEAKYSCATIEPRWFAIEGLVAVQAPVKEKNIWIFPRWSRDVVSQLLVPKHSLGAPQVRRRGPGRGWGCWWQATVAYTPSVYSIALICGHNVAPITNMI